MQQNYPSTVESFADHCVDLLVNACKAHGCDPVQQLGLVLQTLITDPKPSRDLIAAINRALLTHQVPQGEC